MRIGIVAAVIVSSGIALAAENDLPQQPAKPGDASGQELFRGEGGDVLFPAMKLSDAEFLAATEAPANVEQAKAAFEQAQRKEQRWLKLAKAGVLAQVEVERATLQTLRARVRFEQARVAEQEAALNELRSRAGGAAADTIAAAESALQTAKTIAAEAENSLKQTELQLAETNVDRQRRLLKMGAGSKAVLERAEATLAQLRAPAP